MKKTKLFSIFLIILLCGMLSIACGGNSENDDDNNGVHTHTYGEWETATVATYYTTGTKTRACSGEGCSEKQTETIPVTIATKNDFLQARANTVDKTQFEYNYNLNVTTKISAINGPAANTVGNIKYNSEATHKYLRTSTNTGALISDGKVYASLQGTNLETFKVDAANELYDRNSETVSADFKYESSSYAKLLFDESDITSLTKIDGLKYQVTLPTTANIISKGLSALNNPFVANFLTLPDSSGTVNVYITFNGTNGNIEKYEYDFEVSVSVIKVNFHYDLTFTKVGSGVTITPPAFDGYDLTQTAINSTLDTIKSAFNEYRAGNENGVSGHRYDVKTAVDYSWSQNAVDSRSQGRTLRKIDDSDVYFWNRLEFDSDYKNNDQYGSLITDYERYRANLENGDVYDVTDGFLANTYDQVIPYNNADLDNYYFLLQNTFLTDSNISIIKTVTSGTKTTYSLGLTMTGILGLLDFIDDSVRMDVDLTDEKTIFNMVAGSLALKSSKFNIEVTDGKLSKIEIVLKGSYVDSIVKDENNNAKTPSFTLDYTITPYYNILDYTIPIETKNIDLSNS